MDDRMDNSVDIMNPNGRADPFRRVNLIKESALVLVEFCQVLGPKPIECLPNRTSFNLDQIALWIMSSENDHGSTVTIFNQQIGIYAMIHYSTLLDISARAFQRPFAIAYISCEQISKNVAKKFDQYIEQIVNPLLNCNMTMFTHLSEQMINLANSIEERDFHQYYAISADEPSPEMSKCVSELASQIKRVGPRFKNAYSVLSDNNDQNCSCGSSAEDFQTFFPLIGKASATDLMPLFRLSPCGKLIFDDKFRIFYDELTTHMGRSGAILSCNTPVINPVNMFNNLSYPLTNSEFQYQNTLISFSRYLIHILFSIIIGEKVIIAAAKERDSTMKDLSQKLSLLKPSKIKQEIKKLDDLNSLPTFQDLNQFFEINMTRNESLSWITDEQPYSSVQIDLNNQKIKCIQYNGNILKPFNRLHFPSDSSLLSHIAYLMTSISRIVIIANNTSFEKVIKDFKLHEDDQEIILNLLIELNVEKHGYLLKPHNKNQRKSIIYKIS